MRRELGCGVRAPRGPGSLRIARPRRAPAQRLGPLAVFGALLLLGALAPGCRSGPDFERIALGERLRGWREGAQAVLERQVKSDARVRVKPWERDLVARPDMRAEPDALRAHRRSRIFSSKEASLGGGCGVCN